MEFLSTYLKNKGSIAETCKQSGIPRSTVARWFREDPKFREDNDSLFDKLWCNFIPYEGPPVEIDAEVLDWFEAELAKEGIVLD